jgi:hypothetical protein
VAGCAVSDDPRHIRGAFQQALVELGAWIPDRAAAEAIAGRSLARGLVAGRLRIAECADRVRQIWDFDDVLYPALPADLEELVVMSWLQGGEEYEPNGRDQRLLAAARALAGEG